MKKFIKLIALSILILSACSENESETDNDIINEQISEINVDPSGLDETLDFGWEYPNFSRSRKAFKIQNFGDLEITVTSIELPEGFELKEPFSPTTINPGEELYVFVDFRPLSPGTYTGTINVNSDAESGNDSFEVIGESSLTVFDNDGNEYDLVVIGDQLWLAENFRGTTYANGDPIEYSSFTDSSLDLDYGKLYPRSALYNWRYSQDRVEIEKLIDGFHIPNNTAWEELIEYLGGADIAGGKMKTQGTDYWNSPNIGATNSSGFSARAAGSTSGTTVFNHKEFAKFWSYKHHENGSTLIDHAYSLFIRRNSTEADLFSNPNSSHYSVRLYQRKSL